VRNIRVSKYGQVFAQLLATGSAARRAFCTIVGKVIGREVSQYCRGNAQQFPMFTGNESVKSFDWCNVHNEVRTALPTFYAAVCSSMPKKFRQINDELK